VGIIVIHFPVSNVEVYWWLPPLVAFVISCLTSTGGLSGAFLLLPFQISVLGFTGPAVSPTNLIFNVVAIPGGVYRYYREKRMVWPLAWAIIIGTLPGMFLGIIIRVTYLPDPKVFKPFVGFVLAYVGFRLLKDIIFRHGEPKNHREQTRTPPVKPGQFIVTCPTFTMKQVSFSFSDELYQASTWKVFVLCFGVGIIGGAYGIGGGAIVAPFLVTVFGLPVYTVAGAALLSTFISSVAGVFFYFLVDRFHVAPELAIAPDWLLGALFGVGGLAGIYAGARLQRFVPARVIKAFLALCVLSIAAKYISELFI
jgi:uncharacterized membrane protein YfcA